MSIPKTKLTDAQEKLASLLVSDLGFEVFYIPKDTAVGNKELSAVRDAAGKAITWVQSGTVKALVDREVLELVNDDPWVRIYKLRDLSNVLTP